MRLTDLVLTLPGLAVLLRLSAFLGNGSQYRVAVILALLFWTTLARIVRGRSSPCARRSSSRPPAPPAPATRASFPAHPPEPLGPIIVYATLIVAAAILVETALSFLGLRRPAARHVLGLLISDAQDASSQNCPWLFSSPA